MSRSLKGIPGRRPDRTISHNLAKTRTPDARKPGGKDLRIKEQIVREHTLGVTLQFDVTDDGCPRVRILAKGLPVGCLEIGFNQDGLYRWTQVFVESGPDATWIRGAVS